VANEDLEKLEVYNGIHLCPLCKFYDDVIPDSEGFIDLSEPNRIGCILKRKEVNERVVKCKKFRLHEGFSQLHCPQCLNDLYIYICHPTCEDSFAVSGNRPFLYCIRWSTFN